MSKNTAAGSKQNKNAAHEIVEISTGQKVMVQEFAVRNTISILGLVRKILQALKGKDFKSLETQKVKVKVIKVTEGADGSEEVTDVTEDESEMTASGLSSLVDWATLGAELVETNYDDMLGLIVAAQVKDAGNEVLSRGDMEEILLDDVIVLAQAIYRVNFVEGSLKKYVKKLFPKEEQPAQEKELSASAS